jgi:alkylation response protein AidB-like acyl-CoA dehydrogenase
LTESLVLSRRDLDFLLFEWLDVTSLTDRERFREHSRDTFDSMLELAELIATRDFATHNRKADENEPRLVDGKIVLIPEIGVALRKFADAGLLGAHSDAALGGLQVPTVIAKAALAWFQAANIGTSAYAFLTIANANLIRTYGSAEQIDRYVRPMLEGRFFGTMCLSEPAAGSSLADITTTATDQGDGTYRLVGNKMWISGGDHELAENIVHLVLAKTPGAPAGVHGISLFIVPKYIVDTDGSVGERNDVVAAGLNHKMGYRGTVNTALNFGEGAYRPGGRPGAVGHLVGELHAGLKQMFHMMNEARIGVGVGASALGYTSYLHALAYAKTRRQGRSPAARDPGQPPVPIIEHPDVRRMLLAQKSYVEGGLALGLYCARLVDDEQTAPDPEIRRRASQLLDVLTPIAKAWPSQWGLTATDLAIQIHGGYGYTRDYPVEQFYRDNRLNPIHEGTNGIQAIDLLGRKVTQHGGEGLRLLAERIRATVDAATTDTATADTATADAATGSADVGDLAKRLAESLDAILAVTERLDRTGEPDLIMAHASAYLDAFGHVVVAWIWLEQALAAFGRDDPFYRGKVQAAEYFIRCELPRAQSQIDLIATLDRSVADMQPAWL